jgi:MFS superfamily sulfate permease-like transporter
MSGLAAGSTRRATVQLVMGVGRDWRSCNPAQAITVDVTACDIVAELDQALHAQGIELCFAELKDPVKDKLKRFGLFTQLGENYFFPTIGVAVSRYLETNNVEWEDWEDRTKG